MKSRFTSEIVLPGTGEESRDYIYIDDILNSLKCIVDKAEYIGESYNVGSGNEFVIKDVAELFFRKIGWTGTFEFNGEVRAGDPIHWQADISKINQFGFKPLVSLEEGLDKYLTWIKIYNWINYTWLTRIGLEGLITSKILSMLLRNCQVSGQPHLIIYCYTKEEFEKLKSKTKFTNSPLLVISFIQIFL